MNPLEPAPRYRVASIDIVRGLVMIIMALDHTRDFFMVNGQLTDPTNMQATYPALFFTRWITHFCAPTFVFLSGASAFLAARRKTENDASAFLIKRGLWLILVEVTIVTLGITFDPLYHFIVLQVIWAIGASMLLLGLTLRLSSRLILPLGLILVLGHDICDYINFPQGGPGGTLARLFLVSPGFFPIAPGHLIGALYAVLPWTGLMMVGYSIGKWFTAEVSPEKRQRILLQAGLAVTGFFLLLRAVNHYGDPAPWSVQPRGAVYTFLSFLNTSKYPPSLLYSSMTIGPALILLSLTERARNGVARVLTVYGKVPFFYYVLHFYLLHVLVVILFFASGYGTKDIVTPNSPFLFAPPGFGFPLAGVYGVWFVVVASLYYPCRWFGKYKQQHPEKRWLSYC